ncbi:response regulator [Mesorhizobium sp. B2-1-8]|uniref:response regulator n=1 Tax=Mesorhizobium sp. B2-1-8 TaxID=2589967 RepID=UPI00112EF2CD|nr:response regulator [Mesorhizobium sp. B2-1-8]UCI16986.1 response regulator [Mesorhizobium sp. B2-1-8]
MENTLNPRYRNGLSGARILVADDEILIALDIVDILADAGAQVVGPCTTLAETLKFAQHEELSAATLDIRLGRETTEAVAAALADRGIPFIFYSGQALPASIEARWPNCQVIGKPADQDALVNALKVLLKSI